MVGNSFTSVNSGQQESADLQASRHGLREINYLGYYTAVNTNNWQPHDNADVLERVVLGLERWLSG